MSRYRSVSTCPSRSVAMCQSRVRWLCRWRVVHRWRACSSCFYVSFSCFRYLGDTASRSLSSDPGSSQNRFLVLQLKLLHKYRFPKRFVSPLLVEEDVEEGEEEEAEEDSVEAVEEEVEVMEVAVTVEGTVLLLAMVRREEGVR